MTTKLASPKYTPEVCV